MLKYVVRTVVVLALPFSVVDKASAQDAFQTIANSYSNMAMNGLVQNQLAITQATIGRRASQEMGAPSSSSPRQQLDAKQLTFRSSPTVRQRNYVRFVEQSRRVDPRGAVSLAKALQSDPLAQVTSELARAGLRINNVADAYAAYWTESWEAAHRRPVSTSSAEQIEAVKQQAAEAILATPEMARASDADKQQFAEALWLQTLGLSAAREQAQGNPQQLQAIAGAARKGARSMGLDLDAMTLTEQGFVPAGKKVGTRDDAPGKRSANIGSGLLVGATLAGLGFGSLWLMKGQSSRGGG